jgi:chloramphenicol 3-O phosphotransferase
VGHVIILNGTSSSGKSSIANSLQHKFSGPIRTVSLDWFQSIYTWGKYRGDSLAVAIDACMDEFHRCIAVISSGSDLVVVDHVFESHQWYCSLVSLLQPKDVLMVGVHCPLNVLKLRETARGDRKIGLAEKQYNIVHQDKKYNISVDTSRFSADECADIILFAYDSITA